MVKKIKQKQKQSQRVSQVVKINIGQTKKSRSKPRKQVAEPSQVRYSQPITPFQFQSPFGLPSQLNKAVEAIIEPQFKILKQDLKLQNANFLNNLKTIQLDDVVSTFSSVNPILEAGSNALGQARSFDNEFNGGSEVSFGVQSELDPDNEAVRQAYFKSLADLGENSEEIQSLFSSPANIQVEKTIGAPVQLEEFVRPEIQPEYKFFNIKDKVDGLENRNSDEIIGALKPLIDSGNIDTNQYVQLIYFKNKKKQNFETNLENLLEVYDRLKEEADNKAFSIRVLDNFTL